MFKIADFGLKENPFPLYPDFRVKNWAGRQEERLRLKDITESVLSSDTGLSEFVILHGSYGAGKSHALRYFTTLINEVEQASYNARAIYLPKMKMEAKVSFVRIYFEVIEELGEDFLKELSSHVQASVKAAADELSNEVERQEERRLRERDTKVFERRVIGVLPREEVPMANLLIELAEGNTAVVTYLMKGKPVVKDSGFAQTINSDYTAAKILASLFRAMTAPIGNQPAMFSGAHLFVDEVEDILEVKSPEQLVFWQATRELVNRLPYNFCLVLSFSADTALLEAIVPTGLAERMSRPYVELPTLEVDEAKAFVRAHLKEFRPTGYKAPQPFYPFKEEAVDYVLEQIVLLVPRKIFRNLRAVLERAIKREGLEPGQEIDAALAEEILVSMGM